MKNRQPNLYRILFFLCCLALIPAGCRSVDSDGTSVATIKVTPSSTTMKTGEVIQLTAEKLYTNAASSDCTASATWTSSNTSVAGFSTTANGSLSALAAGTTTITVSCDGTSKSYSMTVTGAATLQSIEVSPVNKTISSSAKLIVFATGVFSDNSTVDMTNAVHWTSSNDAVLTLERSNGSDSIQAAPASAGTVTVTAQYGSISGSTTIVVNATTLSAITVTPNDPTMAVDHKRYMKATGFYSDNTVLDITDFATWSSTSPSAVIVSNVDNGLTTALSAGTSTLRATIGGSSDTVSLTVGSATLSSIEIYPSSATIVKGSSRKFSAVGIYSDNSTIDLTRLVTWSSSNTSLLSVDSSYWNKGRATALDSGSVFLSAGLSNSTVGASAAVTIADLTLSSIQVTPTNLQIPANLEQEYKATGVFNDGSTQDLTDSVIWSSSAAGVMKISNLFQSRGTARSLSSGTATITATFDSTSGTSAVTVSNATLTAPIQITPPNSNLANGYKRQLKATGIYSDNSAFDLTKLVAWKSSAGSIIMDNTSPSHGVAIATASGASPTITATFPGMDGQDGAISGTTLISTTTATLSTIEIEPTNPICMKGLSINFKATGIFSDATTQDMTSFVIWKSSDRLVSPTINADEVKGLFTCIKAGETTVTATSGTTSGTTTLYVADQ